ncbi:integrase catalytic domain-containing protein [Nephila pilipes]|uniref:Integrase catalytic domain-containing protein n=1 Tax=Nephila pilipes TaxID=299642 RepID=A0A8X6JQ87_NEPPI|nr:integrase catalytic domain-containing protein [Nephila pilipes]
MNLATAYHLQADGLIEGQYLSIKASLRCYLSSLSWVENLQLVLLGLLSVMKQDLNCSSAELEYGSPLNMQGEFFSKSNEIKHSKFLCHLQTVIRDLKPHPTNTHGRKAVFVASELSSCSYIFIFNNAATLSL